MLRQRVRVAQSEGRLVRRVRLEQVPRTRQQRQQRLHQARVRHVVQPVARAASLVLHVLEVRPQPDARFLGAERRARVSRVRFALRIQKGDQVRQAAPRAARELLSQQLRQRRGRDVAPQHSIAAGSPHLSSAQGQSAALWCSKSATAPPRGGRRRSGSYQHRLVKEQRRRQRDALAHHWLRLGLRSEPHCMLAALDALAARQHAAAVALGAAPGQGAERAV